MSIKMNIEIKKNLAKNWFILLRDIICYEIEIVRLFKELNLQGLQYTNIAIKRP